jgi:hypothetical protein
MRKLAGILAVTAFVMGSATAVFSGPLPATGVFKSPHDMNTKGQVDSMERTCVFCHTPHNATPDDTGVNTYPLWNHTLPSTTGWQNYVWAAPLNSGLNTSDPLAGPSRLCMSCHDGVTAFDTHNGAIAQAGGTKLSGAKAVGRNSDLTDDHPIGFSYGDCRDHGTRTENGRLRHRCSRERRCRHLRHRHPQRQAEGRGRALQRRHHDLRELPRRAQQGQRRYHHQRHGKLLPVGRPERLSHLPLLSSEVASG